MKRRSLWVQWGASSEATRAPCAVLSPTRSLLRQAVVGLLVAAAGTAAHAQRGQETRARSLSVMLPKPVMFGDQMVPAGRYRVSLSTRGMSLAHPTTMVTVATVPATETADNPPVASPTAELVSKKDGVVEIIVRSNDRVVVATGVETTGAGKSESPDVELAGRSDAELGPVHPKAKSELELVEHALSKRYLRDVAHCADQAHRSHWKTDDRRFIRCVCPIAERWRLPPVSNDMRVHQALAKGKSGMSLTVSTKGKVSNCRVWVGPKPPSDEPPAGVLPEPAPLADETPSEPEESAP
jgi:hypothetical protein